MKSLDEKVREITIVSEGDLTTIRQENILTEGRDFPVGTWSFIDKREYDCVVNELEGVRDDNLNMRMEVGELRERIAALRHEIETACKYLSDCGYASDFYESDPEFQMIQSFKKTLTADDKASNQGESE